jgi:hypothetical protein
MRQRIQPDHMHAHSRRHVALDPHHEGEKVLLFVFGPALMLHIAGADAEGGEQRRGPVSLVVMRERPRPSFLERASWFPCAVGL